MPTESAIAQEMQSVERQRKELFDPNNAAIRNPAQSFPKVPTPDPAQIDVEALARRYERGIEARKTDELMVFASFSMPRESLRRLLAQASQVGAAVVLRGFKDNSLKATAAAISELGENGGQSGNVLINPDAFTKYRVTAVPVVLLAKPESIAQVDLEGCALPDTYASVAGDVSLDYALDEIGRRDMRFAALAERYSRQLRARP